MKKAQSILYTIQKSTLIPYRHNILYYVYKTSSSGVDLMMKHHLIVVQLDLVYHFQEYSEEWQPSLKMTILIILMPVHIQKHHYHILIVYLVGVMRFQ